jgi:hypothetical protein
MHLGADDDSPLEAPGRDAVSLSIASIDLSTLETLQAPTYRIVSRQQWVGLNHLVIFGQLKSLVESWNPQYLVIDATGVGEGLWAMLDKAFPRRVIPVKFTAQEKSEIGWRFLAIIETGRFRAFCEGPRPGQRSRSTPLGQAATAPTADMSQQYEDLVRLQYESCRSEVLPGPGRTLRWGVPEGTRGPDGALVHDDSLLADSLVAKLDSLSWSLPCRGVFISFKETPEQVRDRVFFRRFGMHSGPDEPPLLLDPGSPDLHF